MQFALQFWLAILILPLLFQYLPVAWCMLIGFARRKYEKRAVKATRVPDSIMFVLAATHFRESPNDRDDDDDMSMKRRKRTTATSEESGRHSRVPESIMFSTGGNSHSSCSSVIPVLFSLDESSSSQACFLLF